ncbi:MAG: hypothetical protein WA655_23160 [Candidatus Korobacteraceae bacterium]
MRWLGVLATYLLLSIFVCVAQSPGASPASNAAASGQAANPSADSGIQGVFGTTLVKPLDSKKLKAGDQVICQTAGPIHSRSDWLIPSGAKVYGHVTQASARSKGDSDSSLAIAFDKIEVSKSRVLPMKGVLQSVAPSLGNNELNTGNDIGSSNLGKAAGSGRGGGESTPVATPTPTVGVTSNNVRNVAHPMLNSQSVGVLGFKNLDLDKNGVLTSTGKEIKLDSGTQMMIRGAIEVPVE